jgi:hypothetical protein
MELSFRKGFFLLKPLRFALLRSLKMQTPTQISEVIITYYKVWKTCGRNPYPLTAPCIGHRFPVKGYANRYPFAIAVST